MGKIGTALVALALATSAAQAEPLKVEKERTRIQVDAQATGHAFTGTLEDYEIRMTGDGSSLKPGAFSLTWKFADLKTGEAERDEKMIEWLETADPKGSFELTKTWVDEKGTKFAQGVLTIHGVKKTVAFPYEVKREGRWVTVDGTAEFDTTDFGLPVIRAMLLMTVDPHVKVRFHVVGTL